METKEMNLYEKLMNITAEIGVVSKNLYIAAGSASYKAVSERDVLDAVRPLLSKYRVYCYPVSRELVEKDVMVTTSKYGDKSNLYFHYRNVTRFVNVDKPEEYIDVPSYSTGIDSGDKADGKAMTYGDKYALLKAFMISTGEDPDQEKSTEMSQKSYITKKQFDDLKNMFTADDIKKWMEKLGISSPKLIPTEEYDKLIESSLKQNKASDKEFY